MTTADEIHALVTRHTRGLSDALDAMRLRPLDTGYAALIYLPRVRY
jgi:hypothetical protein